MVNKLLLLALLLMTSCTKKVWQCTTTFSSCPGRGVMHSEDFNKTGVDSFYKDGKIIYEYINCK